MSQTNVAQFSKFPCIFIQLCEHYENINNFHFQIFRQFHHKNYIRSALAECYIRQYKILKKSLLVHKHFEWRIVTIFESRAKSPNSFLNLLHPDIILPKDKNKVENR